MKRFAFAVLLCSVAAAAQEEPTSLAQTFSMTDSVVKEFEQQGLTLNQQAIADLKWFEKHQAETLAIHELTIVDGSPVEGARVERLVVGSAGGAVTVELLVDGEVKRRAVVEGAGATITDLRVGKTW